MSDWFSSSYMARRGVAGGRVGKTHHLTEAKQGSYQYVYGPYAEPVLTIAPGDVVVAETHDAFEGAIKIRERQAVRDAQHARSSIRRTARSPSKARKKATSLCVHIEAIMPRGPQPVGTSALIPEFGGLVGNAGTPMLNPPLPERVMKYRSDRASGVRVQRQDHAAVRAVHRNARRQPADRSGLVAAAGLLGRQHGPARRRPGRDRLFPGATQRRLSLSRRLPWPQGDGELCGVAVEIPSTTTIQVDLIKNVADRLAAAREREASS